MRRPPDLWFAYGLVCLLVLLAHAAALQSGKRGSHPVDPVESHARLAPTSEAP